MTQDLMDACADCGRRLPSTYTGDTLLSDTLLSDLERGVMVCGPCLFKQRGWGVFPKEGLRELPEQKDGVA